MVTLRGYGFIRINLCKAALVALSTSTVSCTDRDNKLIPGSLPVPVGANIVALVKDLIEQTREFINPEILLFDQGFDDYHLAEALQRAGCQYQILWRKNKWATKMFKKNETRGNA